MPPESWMITSRTGGRWLLESVFGAAEVDTAEVVCFTGILGRDLGIMKDFHDSLYLKD
jgi:hypothetical protein